MKKVFTRRFGDRKKLVFRIILLKSLKLQLLPLFSKQLKRWKKNSNLQDLKFLNEGRHKD
jgi:hypothetical protein